MDAGETRQRPPRAARASRRSAAREAHAAPPTRRRRFPAAARRRDRRPRLRPRRGRRAETLGEPLDLRKPRRRRRDVSRRRRYQREKHRQHSTRSGARSRHRPHPRPHSQHVPFLRADERSRRRDEVRERPLEALSVAHQPRSSGPLAPSEMHTTPSECAWKALARVLEHLRIERIQVPRHQHPPGRKCPSGTSTCSRRLRTSARSSASPA